MYIYLYLFIHLSLSQTSDSAIFYLNIILLILSNHFLYTPPASPATPERERTSERSSERPPSLFLTRFTR